MPDSDLDYVDLVYRLGFTVADGLDPGANPDILRVVGGYARVTPIRLVSKNVGAQVPQTLIGAAYDFQFDVNGYISQGNITRTYNGATVPAVRVVDLGSAKMYDPVDRDVNAYTLSLHDIIVETESGQKLKVSNLPSFSFHPTPTGTLDKTDQPSGLNDLTLLQPVSNEQGAPIVIGPRGLTPSIDRDGEELTVTYVNQAGQIISGPFSLGDLPVIEVEVGDTDTVAPGQPAKVIETVTPGKRVLDFEIPQGIPGQWATGAAEDVQAVKQMIVDPTAVRAELVATFAKFNAKVAAHGIKGDNVADDTAGIRALFAAAQGALTFGVSGAQVTFPAGEYLISDTIDLRQFSGIIEGNGVGNSPFYTANRGNATVFRWVGPADRPMFLLHDYRNVNIRDIRFEGNNESKPTYAIESRWTIGESAGTNASLQIDRCHFGDWVWSTKAAGLQGKMQAAIGFTGDNGNNDQWQINNCIIAGCDIGLNIPNSQSIWGSVSNTTFSTNGIHINAGASFEGFNVSFNASSICDVKVLSTATVDITGWFSENSAQIAWATGLGRIIARGGLWRLQAAMGTNPMVRHDVATGGAGVMLDGVEFSNTLGTHPKIKMTATGGGATPGVLSMVACKVGMTYTDFDILTVGSNKLIVNILASGNLQLERVLPGGVASLLAGLRTIYIDGDGRGNDANSGLTPETPKATLAGAAAAMGNVRGRFVLGYGVISAGAGFSFTNLPVSMIGPGSGYCTIKATLPQTGPVLDFTGVGGNNNRVTIGGFAVEGDNTADATNTNKGVAFSKTVSLVGLRMYDVLVRNTGGAAFDWGCVELSEFDHCIAMPPVGAAANDIPWIEASGAFNGNYMTRCALLSLSLVANVGPSGALRVYGTAATTPHDNVYEAWWTQSLLVANGGTIVDVKGNANMFRDWQFFDTAKASGATDTSHYRFMSGPHTTGVLGANEVSGLIIGRGTAGNSIDFGVDIYQPRNVVVGNKGFRGYNVRLRSGATNCYVRVAGGYGATSDPAVVDESGVFNNRVIDEYLQVDRGPYVLEPRYASQGAAGPRFSDPTTPANGAVWYGTTGVRSTAVGTSYFDVADAIYRRDIAGTGAPREYMGPSTAWPSETVGNGSPEGVVSAVVGSTYRRRDGGAGTSFYVKESGSASAGWVAK